MKYIYTITSLRVINKNIISGHRIQAERTFGFFFNEKSAIDAVLNNKGNLEEYLYNYLVIEKLSEGIHPRVISEIWFQWITDRWIPIPQKPDYLKQYVNFSLG